jgi:hypothetical protein
MADIIQENREIHDKLRSIVNHLRIFDNFVNNVKNIVEKKLYEKQNKITLIVSDRLDQQIIENILHLKQIISIFGFFFVWIKIKMNYWQRNIKVFILNFCLDLRCYC